ncbi:ABC transporter ATP-binding protein [Pacificispira sp.]|uniref:ABC transporter ATP-binding protein n=1 Tax=Pacificispira sp. TaxID=2888761 RepID=UPI003BAC460E
MTTPLVELKDLRVRFKTPRGTIQAVNGIDLSLAQGEVLGILGESGSGKSVMLRSLLRLLPPRTTTIEGSVRVGGRDVLAMSPRALSAYRGDEVSMVFQEPMLALDPVFTIGDQIAEAILRHRSISKHDAYRRARDLLDLVQIPSATERLKAYPHEMSGGMRQRAMIALALSCEPRLLLADEPTTALDATVQIQVLLLLRELQRELDMAVIFVTHDVGVAVEISDRLAVMYAGRVVEEASVAAMMADPLHPYTTGLLQSTDRPEDYRTPLTTIAGSPPDLVNLGDGCAFAPRCDRAMDKCRAERPVTRTHRPGRTAACWDIRDAPDGGSLNNATSDEGVLI